jgi:FkbM family methyltransferase
MAQIYKYKFFNKKFEYFLFFQEYFKEVRNINNSYTHFEHSEYTSFVSAILELVPKNKIIIDVGANSGLLCVPLCKYGYNVIAFEPVETSVECLKLSKIHNNLENLKISSFALSNKIGDNVIYVPNSEDNASMISEISTSNLQNKTYNIQKINTITLDQYVLQNNINPNDIGHIKVDVQGLELEVIEGLENVLRESENISLIIEWDVNHSGRENLDKILNILNKYNIKEIQRDGIFFNGKDGNKIFIKQL